MRKHLHLPHSFALIIHEISNAMYNLISTTRLNILPGKAMLLAIGYLLVSTLCLAQSTNVTNAPRYTVAVLAVAGDGGVFDGYYGTAVKPEEQSRQTTNLVRLELQKLDIHNVLYAYDMDVDPKVIATPVEECLSQRCGVEYGRALGVDRVVNGSIDRFRTTGKIVVTLRLIDVRNASIERSVTVEYRDVSARLNTMIELTLRKLFDISYDQEVYDALTIPAPRDNSLTEPHADQLRLSGPRMGVTMFTGESSEVLGRPRSEGGYDLGATMFQLGYQFEVQYINEGNWQALFEIIPTVTGIDQGEIIPSLAVINGLRHNLWGFEVGIGATIFGQQTAQGYFDGDGVFVPVDSADEAPDPSSVVRRRDSRGDYSLTTGMVLAAGKSFRLGRLNVPVNVFWIPRRGDQRYGISVGYNLQRD